MDWTKQGAHPYTGPHKAAIQVWKTNSIVLNHLCFLYEIIIKIHHASKEVG